MTYVDSNIFLYAILESGPKGDKARKFLEDAQDGKILIATCCLTYDEIVWNVRRYRDHQTALSAGKSFLRMPAMKLLPVGVDCMLRAQEFMESYPIRPRDAIHLASCVLSNIAVIVSEDSDFDKVGEVKRKTLANV